MSCRVGIAHQISVLIQSVGNARPIPLWQIVTSDLPSLIEFIIAAPRKESVCRFDL